ncbi:hypothetical protein [Aliikangiella sp. IMCC44359]|uniref:hypothetical protein n=1 Tax=Aliikangiella sp. IMCC44359 TaxID=3459125 RepID=UPI00403AE53E
MLGKKSKLVIFFLMVISIITFISILGENHRIEGIVTNYFNQLKNGNYLVNCKHHNNHAATTNDVEQCMDQNFLIELSLLKHYQLLDNNDYIVYIKPDLFWIPYITQSKINVDIQLFNKTQEDSILFSSKKLDNPVKKAFEIERVNGVWKISGVQFNDKKWHQTYNELKENITLNQYIERRGEQLALKEILIQKNSSAIDKKLLRFSLYKLNTFLK